MEFIVEQLRGATKAAAKLADGIKWGHLVYFSNRPVLLIRPKDERMLFGFWRRKRLVELEPRLKPSGKYELATATFVDGDTTTAAKVKKLVTAAVALNHESGNPTQASK